MTARQIRETVIPDKDGDIRVSTVFLGLDHSFKGGSQPILFETMIFGGREDHYQERYATKQEAIEGHERALLMAIEAKVWRKWDVSKAW